MLSFPNAKINLGLFITGKRPDGFHNLETVFYPVSIKDALEIVPSEKSQFHLSGKAIASESKENLVWKAYELMKIRYPGQVTELDIYLLKAIPMGAGLGGGSADAAFMLRLINDYFELMVEDAELATLALQLGSDCPFFIYNKPAFASGRGENLEEISLDLSAYSIQVICPGIHVSTKEAFSKVQPMEAAIDLRTIGKLPVEEWKDRVINDFEVSVFANHPQLANIKSQLYDQGAIYASMSGSGSAIFGIFLKGKKAAIDIELPFEEFIV
jgi:4-diphosphocytidyl-2-C-methyl-D-erythritol kinase